MKKYHVLLLSFGMICGCSTNHTVSSSVQSLPQSPSAEKVGQNIQNGSPALNENNNSTQQRPQMQNLANQSSKSSQINQSDSKPNDNRYEIAGIEDAKAFEKFFMKLQKAVDQSNKQEVANVVHYPISVMLNGKKTFITSADSFIKNYDQIVTPQVKKAIMNQRIQEAFVRDQGVMVGEQGEMWLGVSNNNPHKFYIIAINNDI